MEHNQDEGDEDGDEEPLDLFEGKRALVKFSRSSSRPSQKNDSIHLVVLASRHNVLVELALILVVLKWSTQERIITAFALDKGLRRESTLLLVFPDLRLYQFRPRDLSTTAEKNEGVIRKLLLGWDAVCSSEPLSYIRPGAIHRAEQGDPRFRRERFNIDQVCKPSAPSLTKILTRQGPKPGSSDCQNIFYRCV